MMFKRLCLILLSIIFFNILISFKVVKAVNNHNIYLVLDEMYVVDDLNDIVNKINYLNDRGIPFIISTMPIFNNTNIQAAQRYYEVLRYAEGKNGSIILHFPDISESNIININMEKLIDKMTVSYNTLIDYKVYPKAIDIPEKLLKHKNIKDYLNLSNTVFIEENNNIELLSNNNIIENIIYYEYDEKKEYISNLGIVVPSNIEFNEFKEILYSLNKREIYFNDFSYLNTSIKIGENEIKLKDSNLYLNNNNVTVQRFISKEEFKSTVNEEKVEKDGIDLSKLNKGLIIITAIATIIFIIIAISNRRIDRNKFFK